MSNTERQRKTALEKHSININILGRQFPAIVDSEEAAVIQEAAAAINSKIKGYKSQYKGQQDLDIVLMCCLEIMTERLKSKAHTEKSAKIALDELNILTKKLDYSLQLSEKN